MPYLAKAALVTGSTEPLSLGYATALNLAADHKVFLHARSESQAVKAVQQLKNDKPDAEVDYVVIELSSCEGLEEAVAKVGPRLDVLVNNASIRVPPHQTELFQQRRLAAGTKDDPAGIKFGEHFGGVDQLPNLTYEDFERIMRVNFGAPLRLTNAFTPSLLASPAPRIVNVSSGRGSFAVQSQQTIESQGILSYNISKAALNMLTLHTSLFFCAKHPNAKVNAAHPGTPKNRYMPNAPLELEDAAALNTWLARLPAAGPTSALWEALPKAQVEKEGFKKLEW